MIEVVFVIEGFGLLNVPVRAIPSLGNYVTLDNVAHRVTLVNHDIRTITSKHEVIIHLEKAD